jgi:hypothetical protein
VGAARRRDGVALVIKVSNAGNVFRLQTVRELWIKQGHI